MTTPRIDLSKPDHLAAGLAVLIREQKLDDANLILNRLTPTQLRATLIEAVANTVEVTDHAQAKVAQIQKGVLTVLGTYALQRQAELLNK